MIGYLFCKTGVNEVTSLLDYRTIGGTQFLGIKKPVIKAHGASDALAFRNAIRQAQDAAACNVADELAVELQKLTDEKESDHD
jgi:glycerol-3-phosphate acyltransferase PlsX